MFASVFVAMEPLTPILAAWVTVAMEQWSERDEKEREKLKEYIKLPRHAKYPSKLLIAR